MLHNARMVLFQGVTDLRKMAGLPEAQSGLVILEKGSRLEKESA